MKIDSVVCQVLTTARLNGAKTYEDTAGLRFPEAPGDEGRFAGRVDTRHLCVYPADRFTALVRVRADNGMEGIGEAHAPAAPRVVKTIVEDLLAPLLVGADPRPVDVLWERMFSAMRLRSHTQGFTLEAIAGIDIALWDLLGKLYGAPVWRLLGGPYRTRLPVYASGVPGGRPEERADRVARILSEGFTALKASCGRGHIDDQMAMLRGISDAVGNQARLLVDAHGAFDLPDALRFARFLEDLGNVEWFEDALMPEDHRGYRALTRATSLRIALGETDCNRYTARDRLMNRECNVLLPDVCRAGGISETLKVARLADVFGVSWASHVSTSTPIHLLAGLHVGAATPNFFLSEFPTDFHKGPFGNVLVRDALAVEDGYVTLDEKPGLGVELNEAEVARLIIA